MCNRLLVGLLDEDVCSKDTMLVVLAAILIRSVFYALLSIDRWVMLVKCHYPCLQVLAVKSYNPLSYLDR